VRGHRRFAGEIGHVVIDPDGPQCPCGRRGCWEMFASGNALSRLAARADLRDEDRAAGVALPLDALGLVAAARRGDAEATELIEQFATYIALGFTNVVELLDTGRIVIAGGLANSADVLLEPIRAAFATLSRPSQRLAPEQIVIATLENRAASIGAALLGLDLV
jgi:glucokinase